ncbi:MAG TPA: Fe-Mn family superoxide dismutase [Holophagaceae bacterium]|jgi:Fe-Mn family superoxide dismutase|nr:Fe-Mn family superoxide dismutase [Holophagaceae bacterium]
MSQVSRREMLGFMAAGSAATLVHGHTSLAKAVADQAMSPAPAPPGAKSVVPLPFDPSKLKGISEKLITSHHQNNYAGAVKNLNGVRGQLAGLAKDAPGFLVGGLRAKELTYANSATLHEAYFANLGGDGKADGPTAKALGATFGSTAAWEEAFRALGGSLSGGSGWAILDYALTDGSLRIAWAGDHTQTLATSYPLLVMDMYEHAYQMDYGAAAGKYIDAFFQNVQWDEVNRRLERARKAYAALSA